MALLLKSYLKYLGGVPVLLITPREDIAVLTSEMIKTVAATHRLVISTITREDQVPSKFLFS